MVTTSQDPPGKKTQIMKPGKNQPDPKKTPRKPTTKPKPVKK